jgi:hypothetical protein
MEKNMYKGPYRRVDFKEPQAGSYVTVYQRPGEDVLFDLNFFDGDQTTEDVLLRIRLINAALEQANQWSNE